MNALHIIYIALIAVATISTFLPQRLKNIVIGTFMGLIFTLLGLSILSGTISEFSSVTETISGLLFGLIFFGAGVLVTTLSVRQIWKS